MVCGPSVSDDVVKAACPAPSRETLTRVVGPSLKVTEPVGMVGPRPVTVAVKVTVWPKLDGLGMELIAVVLDSGAATVTHAENSDVLLLGSVTVTVTTCPSVPTENVPPKLPFPEP